MKAICIDDKTEPRPNFKGQIETHRVKGLTEGQIYQVEQSKESEGYYVVLNDAGVKEKYKKERFEIMEDKIIKIECVNTGSCGNIELGIGYDAIENEKGFRIISDYNYPKEYFKKVEPQKEYICYNNECQHNVENRCGIGNVTQLNCSSHLKEPINYKEENERMIDEIKSLNESIKFKDKCFHELNDKYQELKAEVNQLREELQESNFKLKEYETKMPQLKGLVVKLVKINEILASNIYEGMEE